MTSPELKRFIPDIFTIALLSAVLLATLLPIEGEAAHVFRYLTDLAIAVLFFMNGARLSREAVIAGVSHWRLHLLVTFVTYGIFPILGEAITFGLSGFLGSSMALGFLYLSCLPSTIQSSIAFTSIARGNVPAAICSATLSNVIGIFLTPILVGLLLSAHGGTVSIDAFVAIIVQLLIPFALGQALRPWIAGWMMRQNKAMAVVDRGSIVMIVYGAFSDAVTGGIWQTTSSLALLWMTVVACLLLAVVLAFTSVISRKIGFNRPDQIAIIFCGSKKSMASGIPMASILFPAAAVGSIVLPVMIFHQIQLMACAWLSRRYAEQDVTEP